jgi:hypothetical protein
MKYARRSKMKSTKIVVLAFAGLVLSMSQYAVADDAIHVTPAGDVGFGTNTPITSVEVVRSDGSAKISVVETNLTKGPRDLFEIINNGNPEFRMTNSGNGNSWLFSSGLRFVVKNNAGDWVSRVDVDGNMEITGTLTTAGGTCGGGCDLVFDQETNIATIEEHASEMWANSYLPAVGPTVENAPFNITEKTGGMLNELEKAHIYIEQLHIRLAALEAEQAELKQAVMKVLENQQGQRVLTGTAMN